MKMKLIKCLSATPGIPLSLVPRLFPLTPRYPVALIFSKKFETMQISIGNHTGRSAIND
jgi:hypothetical protein